MKKRLVSVLYLVVGLINFTPVLGILGQERLAKFYGVKVTSPDLLLLLQHRALLFGIIGGLILVSVVRHELRKLAATMGFISMVGYIILAFSVGAVNDALIKVAYYDIGALFLLMAALILQRQQVTPQ